MTATQPTPPETLTPSATGRDEPAEFGARSWSLPRRAELWSGRFAMLGVTVTAIALALQ